MQQMAAQGLHLKAANVFGIYTFIKGAPADMVYRLDYVSGLSIAYLKSFARDPHYRQLMNDAGWEHVIEINGWQFWRKAIVEGQVPEIFTDAESKIAKYKRVMGIALVSSLGLLPLAFHPETVIRMWEEGTVSGQLFSVLPAALATLFVYAIIKLGLRIRALRSKLR